jgi:hypothetical protein
MRLSFLILFLLITDSVFAIDKMDLVGVWRYSEDGGKTFWGYEEYKADGTLDSWGVFPDSDETYQVKSTFEIKVADKVLSCITIVKSSAPSFLGSGSSWCDEILEATDKTFTYKSSDGEVTTMYRQQLITKP